MKTIFDFTNENGSNCLLISFVSMDWYQSKTGQFPTKSTGMFSEIETTILFLIEQGEKHVFEMGTILNARSKQGVTLFQWATRYSEKIALALLEHKVIVNTITSDFCTPWFKVS